MMDRNRTAALLIATALSPLPALAQRSDSGVAIGKTDIANVDVIVVTAQKRSERLRPAYSPGCVNGRSLPFWEGSSAA
jgi:hypothetical protein